MDELLQETGDAVLQESGESILLESDAGAAPRVPECSLLGVG